MLLLIESDGSEESDVMSFYRLIKRPTLKQKSFISVEIFPWNDICTQIWHICHHRLLLTSAVSRLPADDLQMSFKIFLFL